MRLSLQNRRSPLAPVTLLAAFVALSLVPLPAANAQEEAQLNVIMQAMRDELARSTEQLELEGLEKPYFLAYTVRETEQLNAAGSFGALLSSSVNKGKRLSVEVRIGDPSFDNTNFGSMSLFPSSFAMGGFLPLENDYREIRRQIWLATDQAYKAALESLAEKRAVLQNETRAEDIADFSSEEPFTYFDQADSDLPPRTALEELARDLSAAFRDLPEIFSSNVSVSAGNRRTYYLNSEGSAFIRSDPTAAIAVEARTQATDGTVLNDSVAARGRSWDDINDRNDLESRIAAMGANLTARRSAEGLDRYSGPVLFEGQAAAELFAQVLVPRLLGNRVPDAEPNFARMLQQSRNPFLDRIGARVLPRFLNIHDDPSADGDGFLGGYPVDDDGVEARSKALVENGILKSLLTSRNPVPGIERSTANRRGEGPAPSNLIVASRRGMNDEELHAELMLLVEERGADYGIVVRRMAKPESTGDPASALSLLRSGPQAGPQLGITSLAYRVFPDGREELIPKAELVAVTEAAFRDIVAVSDTSTVYSFPHTPAGGLIPSFLAGALSALGLGELVSVSIPDLLFEELSLRKPSGNAPHLPVANHPSFDP
ncbi:MAG: metallopeptidase TldD-related protein [Acidobacteria bacterium]|nr:metallopeptidase TldD-related protein [Acidobacteriota bacterium]